VTGVEKDSALNLLQQAAPDQALGDRREQSPPCLRKKQAFKESQRLSPAKDEFRTASPHHRPRLVTVVAYVGQANSVHTSGKTLFDETTYQAGDIDQHASRPHRESNVKRFRMSTTA
jgi:hypothetical protein